MNIKPNFSLAAQREEDAFFLLELYIGYIDFKFLTECISLYTFDSLLELVVIRIPIFFLLQHKTTY